MFETCNTLAELNAARISATNEGGDLTEINNAYNSRRQEILNSRSKVFHLTPIIIQPDEVTQYCGIPIAGRSSEVGCIKLTPKGFLY